jgi:ABC-type multidrug transport system fused ATPase/permease subunit
MYNIRYGRLNATESEVCDAAKSAGLHDRILSLPKQYDTVVDEDQGYVFLVTHKAIITNSNRFFSGGEAQRLALARVLLQRADILILDEATSALDADTEAFIKDSINTLCLRKTTIIIA